MVVGKKLIDIMKRKRSKNGKNINRKYILEINKEMEKEEFKEIKERRTKREFLLWKMKRNKVISERDKKSRTKIEAEIVHRKRMLSIEQT